MTKGEFEKRLREQWKPFPNDAVDFFVESDMESIDEARKEFPLNRDTAIYDKDETIKILLKWSEEVLEWFMKWLGEAE